MDEEIEHEDGYVQCPRCGAVMMFCYIIQDHEVFQKSRYTCPECNNVEIIWLEKGV